MRSLVLLPLVSTLLFGASQYAVPQIADGGGWQTTITVFNRVNRKVAAQVTFYAGDGQRLPLSIAGLGVVTSVQLELGPYQARAIETLGAGTALAVGWAFVESQEDIGGLAVFRQRVAGRPDFEAAVPFTPPEAQVISSFDNMAGCVTGVAVANTTGGPIALTFTFRNETGDTVSTRTLTLNPQSHTSFAMTDLWPELAGARGSVHVMGRTPVGAPGEFGALGLRFNATGAFTTLPFFVGVVR